MRGRRAEGLKMEIPGNRRAAVGRRHLCDLRFRQCPVNPPRVGYGAHSEVVAQLMHIVEKAQAVLGDKSRNIPGPGIRKIEWRIGNDDQFKTTTTTGPQERFQKSSLLSLHGRQIRRHGSCEFADHFQGHLQYPTPRGRLPGVLKHPRGSPTLIIGH